MRASIRSRTTEPGDRLHLLSQWAENWNWVHGDSLPTGYPKALDLAKKYVNRHAELAAKLGKPLLLEEFRLSARRGSFDSRVADDLPRPVLQEVYALVSSLLRRRRWRDHAVGLGGDTRPRGR